MGGKGKEKLCVVFFDVSPSFLIFHVNFQCMQQKRKNANDDDADRGIVRWARTKTTSEISMPCITYV